MSIRMDIAGSDSIERANRLLAGINGGIDKALKSTMSRTTAHLRSKAADAVREKYAISKSNLRTENNVKVRYQYGNGVVAEVIFRGSKIPLFRYDGASPKSPTQDTSRQVAFIVGGGWRTGHPGVAAAGHQLNETSPTRFDNAFVARMASGHTGIFERTGGAVGGGSDAISELMGSSLPQMLGNKEVEEKLSQETMKKFEERLDHEVNRLLQGGR